MNEKSTKEAGFEQALSELENLVEQLESGELSLDQSLKAVQARCGTDPALPGYPGTGSTNC